MAADARLIQDVRVEPDGASWGALARRSWERSRRDPARMRVRERLGLPTDRPVFMTGHQPGFWHAGVLAKYFGLEAAATHGGGTCAWVVVDQDDSDPGLLTAPMRNAEGRWSRGEVRLLARVPDGSAAGSLPAGKVVAWDASRMTDSAREGVVKAARALEHRSGSRSLAAQAALAAQDVLQDVLAPAPMHFASDLLRDDDIWAMVRKLDDDAERAIGAYNRAVMAFPNGGVGALHGRDGRWELPVWELPRGGERLRVWSGGLDDGARPFMAPRALLMTAVLRRFVCDLFVHGTGGWSYDRATEAWISEWLGEEVAPMALVTASVLLALDAAELIDASEVARRWWLAHHARHDPALLGRPDLAEQKRGLVAQVDAARARGDDASAPYQAMTSMLQSYREQERSRLSELEHEAQDAAERAGEAEVVLDRTWPFVLHSDESLRALRAQIRSGFGVGQ